uniref:Uncharacterized protein n=1 Tax=Rhizophora mucronata TaxID=61149 RepID=A0A2P2QNS4_RHIMU
MLKSKTRIVEMEVYCSSQLLLAFRRNSC